MKYLVMTTPRRGGQWHVFFQRTFAVDDRGVGEPSLLPFAIVLMNSERSDNSIDQTRDGVLLRFDMHGETELLQRC